MSWKLQEGDHYHYERNPLRVVIAQLRFQPILRISKDVADFQDLVRTEFPSYRTKTEREVKANLENFEVREEDFFIFSDDDQRTLSLTNAHMTLESPQYRHHEEFIQKFSLGLSALTSLFEPIKSTRLGLRYVNIIDKARIERDLGHEVAWADIVDQKFLELPGGLVDSNEATFFNEIVSPVEGEGKMFLRYGLRNVEGQFVFDMDRFVEGDGFEVAGASEMLERFSDQCSYLFGQLVTDTLTRWMSDTTEQE